MTNYSTMIIVALTIIIAAMVVFIATSEPVIKETIVEVPSSCTCDKTVETVYVENTTCDTKPLDSASIKKSAEIIKQTFDDKQMVVYPLGERRLMTPIPTIKVD